MTNLAFAAPIPTFRNVGTALPTVTAINSSLSALLESIPAAYGTIRQIHLPSHSAGKKTVITIQDIHQNTEAQDNISGAIQAIARQGNNILVALEGASGPISLNGFHEFPYQNPVRKAADLLLREGKISGGIHAGLYDSHIKLTGIENRELYESNIQAYRDSLAQAAKARHRIEKETMKVEKEETEVLDVELNILLHTLRQYREGQIPLGEYVKFISSQIQPDSTAIELFIQAQRLEESMDFQRVTKERTSLLERLVPVLTESQLEKLTQWTLAYKMELLHHSLFYQRLRELTASHGISLARFPALNAYIQYVLLTNSLDSEQLFDDLRTAESSYIASHIRSDRERELIQASQRLYLAGRLIEFAMTPKEWDEYKTLRSEEEEYLRPFESFYERADARNKAMVTNLLDRMNARNADTAILVAGGFHSKGIETLLANSGVSFVRYSPRVKEVKDESGIKALSIFSQEKTPLEQLFEGNRLFLAPPPAPRSALNVAAGLVTAQALRSNTLSFSAARAWFYRTTGWILTGAQSVRNGIRLQWKTTLSGLRRSAEFPDDVNGEPQMPTPEGHYAQWSLNSTFILAPILSLTTLFLFGWLPINNPGHFTWSQFWINWPALIAVLAMHKVFLLVSVMIHEASHLYADGQFKNKSPADSLRLIIKSLHWDKFHANTPLTKFLNAASAIVLGYDIQGAKITSSKTSEYEVRRIALYGPLSNIFLVFFGIALMIVGSTIPPLFNLETPILILSGMGLSLSNVALLLLNLRGTDYEAYKTGIAPLVYRMGSAPDTNRTIPEEIITIQIQEGDQALMAFETARRQLLDLPEDADFGSIYRSLANDFLGEAFDKASSRGARQITVRRTNQGESILFEITDDGAMSRDADKFGITNRARVLRASLLIKGRAYPEKGVIASLTVPLKHNSPSVDFPPAPENPEEIEFLVDQYQQLSPEIRSDRLNRIQEVLRSQPDTVDSRLLFFFLRLADKEISQISWDLLAKRVTSDAETNLAPFFQWMVSLPSETLSEREKFYAAYLLFYIFGHPNMKAFVRAQGYNFFDAHALDGKKISDENGRSFELQVDITATGGISVYVLPVRRSFGLERLLSRVAALSHRRLVNLWRQRPVAIYTFTTWDLSHLDPSIPSDEFLFKTCRFSVKGNPFDKATQDIIETWAASASIGTKFLYTAKESPQGSIFDTALGKALKQHHFKFHGLLENQFILVKEESGVGHSLPSYASSPHRNLGLIVNTIIDVVGIFVTPLDEIFHIVFGSFFGLLVPINWKDTEIFSKTANVSHYPAPASRLAWFYASAPTTWFLLLGGFITVAFIYPDIAGFARLLSLNPFVWVMWIIGFSSAAMVMANSIPSNPPSDLYRAFQLLFSKRTSYARARLPRTGGRAYSPWADIGPKVKRFGGLALHYFIEYLKFITFQATKPTYTIGSLLDDDPLGMEWEHIPDNSEPDHPEDQEGLPERIQLILEPIEERLESYFDDGLASASHNRGYWLREARDRISDGTDPFIGSDFPPNLASRARDFLTPEGWNAYRNRFTEIENPDSRAHFLRLNHIRWDKLFELYNALGKPAAGEVADMIFRRGDAQNFIVMDVFARPWYRQNDPEFPSLEDYRDKRIMAEAKRRQIKFVTMVIAIHKTTPKLYLTSDARVKVLWRMMQLLNFQEKESTLFDGNPALGEYKQRPDVVWDRYRYQYLAVEKALPEWAQAHSPFLNLLKLFSWLNATPRELPSHKIISPIISRVLHFLGIADVAVSPGPGSRGGGSASALLPPTKSGANTLQPMFFASGQVATMPLPGVVNQGPQEKNPNPPADNPTANNGMDQDSSIKMRTGPAFSGQDPGSNASIPQKSPFSFRAISAMVRSLLTSDGAPARPGQTGNSNSPISAAFPLSNPKIISQPEANLNGPLGEIEHVGSHRSEASADDFTGGPVNLGQKISKNPTSIRFPANARGRHPEMVPGKMALHPFSFKKADQPASFALAIFSFSLSFIFLIHSSPAALDLSGGPIRIALALAFFSLGSGFLVSYYTSVSLKGTDSDGRTSLLELLNLQPSLNNSNPLSPPEPASFGLRENNPVSAEGIAEQSIAEDATATVDPGRDEKGLNLSPTAPDAIENLLPELPNVVSGNSNDIFLRNAQSPASSIDSIPNETLIFLEAAVAVLLPVRGSHVVEVLQSIAGNNLDAASNAILVQLVKAVQNASHLSAASQKRRDRQDAREPDITNPEISPLEPIQIQKSALILRDEVIQQMTDSRNSAAISDARQIEILKSLLSNRIILNKADFNGPWTYQKLHKPVRLDPSSSRNKKARTLQTEQSGKSASQEEEESTEGTEVDDPTEEPIGIAVKSAAAAIADQSNQGSLIVLNALAEGELNSNETLLTAQFVRAAENAAGRPFQPVLSLSAQNIPSEVPRLQRAAALSIGEYASTANRGPSQETLFQFRSHTRRGFASANTILSVVIIGGAALVALGGTALDLSLREAVSTAVTAAVAIGVLGILRSVRLPSANLKAQFGNTRADLASPMTKAADLPSEDNAAQTILKAIRLFQENKKRESGAALAELLPPAESLGLSGGETSALLQSADENRLSRLESSLKTRISALRFEDQPTLAEAQFLLRWIFGLNGQPTPLPILAKGKNVALALPGGSSAQRETEAAMVNKISSLISQDQKIYMFLSNDTEEKAFWMESAGDLISSGRIQLISDQNIFTTQENGSALDLSLLAGRLERMEKAEVQNLLFLLPENTLWNATNLQATSILDSLSFVLLKDFVAGVPIRKLDILHLDKLARILAIQS